ncbi:TonB-dependent siderophore receptor [Roseateles sp. DC23W]|uniref:TonB-dependent siderophore receptor n=1 Tax=Pelomonas dachongensis TaxID=3299029 RepID=A0ABW7EN07_9BURK
MNKPFTLTAVAVASACALLGAVHAQTTPAPTQQIESVVVTGKRANRISKGATGLAMELKDTPQTISTLDKEDIANFGLTGSNEALALATGINVELWETNRATFNARGFDIQLTQLDGLGMSNSWGTVVGREDTFVFDKIELIRGANGLLTGVGNASGTINYVRKRPTNEDGGEANIAFGSWGKKRIGLDYNKVLSDDGAWAARLVVAHEDKDSYLRDLKDQRTTVYGVVDGQIGRNGVLTVGVTATDSKQDGAMWGSLTLRRSDGTQADLPVGSSTAQKYNYWNVESRSAFIEYAHRLSDDWEAKVTYNNRQGKESTKLFYVYGTLNPDNTGLIGQHYRSEGDTNNQTLDVNLSGRFSAFGRKHDLLVGLNRSEEELSTDTYVPGGDCLAGYANPSLPAQPFGGDAVPEPTWGQRTTCTTGEQSLTRLYVASRLQLTDAFKAILGVNAMRHVRGGQSRYGSGGKLLDPKTQEVSPYVGFTYDITPDVLGYVSYSDIFLPQEQADINGDLLAPVKGINTEVGVKAEWLNKSLLTTFALFTAKQEGLATYAGVNAAGQWWYKPVNVESKGFEIEATGRLGKDAKITTGYTRLILTGDDGKDIYEWVPRNTFNVRVDSGVPALPALRVGIAARWQSDVSKAFGPSQGAYVKADAFAAYSLNDRATLRVNVNNLFDKKAVGGLQSGAIYIPPRHYSVSLSYKL